MKQRAKSIAVSAIRRVLSGLKAIPTGKDWALTGGIFIVYGALAWGFGFLSGLYVWDPKVNNDLIRIALIAIVVPAIGEEAFFRGALVPLRVESRDRVVASVLAMAAFLVWHPINAALFFPEVLGLFSDPRFLLVTGMLGIACTLAWIETRSLWPPILIHWLAVVIWKGFLGAPVMM
jgi:uncharacterized protein